MTETVDLSQFLKQFEDTAAHAEDWPEPSPIPPKHDPPLSLTREMLPEPLASYTFDVAERLSCPPEMVAAPLLVAAGAAIGRGLGIRPKRADRWTEFPNLWGCTIAPPSSMKSPAQSAALAAVEKLEGEWREEHKALMTEHRPQMEAWEIDAKAARQQALKAAAKGGSAGDVEIPEPPPEPTERRLLVNSATPEKLVAIHAANPRGLLVLRDELAGWLRGFDRPGREPERAFYLESWTGQNAYRSDTIGRGSDFLPAACCAVYGSMQPGTFRAYLQASAEAAKQDGLLQRFSLLVWPERTEFQLNDKPPDRQAAWRTEQVFRRLADLNRAGLDAGTQDEFEGPPFLRFEPEAQEAFLEWLENFMRRLPDIRPEAFEGHLSKYRKALPALALIFELTESPSPTAVSLRSWKRARQWGDLLESHLRKVYAPEIRPEVEAAEKILDRLKKGELPPRFTTRQLHKRAWGGLGDLETCRAGLELLARLGWLRGRKADTGGRPSEWWEAHPSTRGSE